MDGEAATLNHFVTFSVLSTGRGTGNILGTSVGSLEGGALTGECDVGCGDGLQVPGGEEGRGSTAAGAETVGGGDELALTNAILNSVSSPHCTRL